MKNEKYCYETPKWAVVSLLFVAAAFSFLCFAGFYYWEALPNKESEFIKWVLFAIGVVFLIAAIRPKNWRAWVYFFADAEGLHFPSECPQTQKTEWLLVPWVRIGTIEKKTFYDRFKGVSIDLRLEEDEIRKFFQPLRLTKKFLGEKISENGFFRVGYSNAFKSRDNAVKVLNGLKEENI